MRRKWKVWLIAVIVVLVLGSITFVTVRFISSSWEDQENKKKDKIIEEMARFMTNKDIDEDICRYQVVEHCKDEKYGVTTNVCINCIKQYFERKRNEL